MLKWTQTTPRREGWYFWRLRFTVTDPWKWNAYFVMSTEGMRDVPVDADGNREPFSLWEAGTEVRWPKGGWWAEIETGE